MEAPLWVIALTLAVGVVVLGWFGLQVALLNARIMHAVVGQQAKLLEALTRMTDLVATIRLGGGPPVASPPPQPYDGDAWIPPDRPVGSS